MKASSNISQILKTAVGVLELPKTDPLAAEAVALCDRLPRSGIRVAVLGPFNYGKSTLLNAILGEKTLPMDLIPTTGAPIVVRYGPTLETHISFKNGKELCQPGTGLLQDYAILDQHRQMRGDIDAIEVRCPHAMLQAGVEFLDLPGTDDQVAQNELVKTQLLTADVVIQLLDGRKLMTLGEREHLRDWLLDRQIETVVFVVNFLNLLEAADQKQVMNRMRFVAESFRAKLPTGVSNLYRVDALPALRAGLKGDPNLALSAGLPAFESALQAIVHSQLNDLHNRPLPSSQVNAIALKLKTALRAKIKTLKSTIKTESAERQQKRLQIQARGKQLIVDGFQACHRDIESWAAPEQLLQQYGSELTLALIRGEFQAWESQVFKPAWQGHLQTLSGWVKKACTFFDLIGPPTPRLRFPEAPVVKIEDIPTKLSTQSPKKVMKDGDAAPTAIAAGLGWLMGGPIGAAVVGGASYVVSQTTGIASAEGTSPEDIGPKLTPFEVVYGQAAEAYIQDFSQRVLTLLQDYAIQAQPVIHVAIKPSTPDPSPQQYHQLSLMEATVMQLDELII